MRWVKKTIVPLPKKLPSSGAAAVRSYVLDPYTMVKDQLTGVTSADPRAVLDGDIEDFMRARLALGSRGADVK